MPNTIYTPILRWKRGERTGLSRLSTAGHADVRPLFVLGVDQFKDRAATQARPAIPAPNAFIADVLQCWGNTEFYVDASALPMRGAQHPIVAIAQAARALGASLIPAATSGAPVPYLAAVQQVEQTDQRGAALRVDLQEFATAAAWVPTWQVPLPRTDLIADFGGNVGTVAALGVALDQTFANLHQGNVWRRVSVAGSSMPDNFQGFPAGTHLIPRVEYQLWQRLRAVPLPYALHYGDFANLSLASPPPGIAWGYPINAKYTRDNDFLICRGVRTEGQNALDMDVQLISHARTIRGYPNRNPLAFCWGDQVIDAIATNQQGPQGLEQWVSFTVNRHIELVRHLLP